MTETDDSLRVLYIAGSGRSGSTILEKILGNLPGFVSIGEVRYFWEYIESGDRLCGCGRPLTECDFWRRVLGVLGLSPAALAHLSALAQSSDRTRYALLQAAGLPGIGAFPPSLLEGTHRLYRAIQEASGGGTIIDSSKVPSHLSLLLRIPEIDVRVLHLVRDPRAYIYAVTKRHKKVRLVTGERDLMRRGTGGATVAWVVENMLSQFWGRRAAEYTLMGYEKFAADPEAALQRALDELRLRPERAPLLPGAELQLRPTHSVGGNPVRFDQAPLMIAEDKAWSTAMPRTTQRLLGLA
ncbi:MAG TPA: sulfotransferase, partial [Anaerolineales bacterium]|nr:sulfotransferase [Anaerolineales bacterium]